LSVSGTIDTQFQTESVVLSTVLFSTEQVLRRRVYVRLNAQ